MGKVGRRLEIDAAVCVALYERLGSVQGVVDALRSRKIVNPRTGKPFGYPTVYAAMKRHPRFAELRQRQLVVGAEQFAALRKELGVK